MLHIVIYNPVRDQEVGSSNLLAPTILKRPSLMRRLFVSFHDMPALLNRHGKPRTFRSSKFPLDFPNISCTAQPYRWARKVGPALHEAAQPAFFTVSEIRCMFNFAARRVQDFRKQAVSAETPDHQEFLWFSVIFPFVMQTSRRTFCAARCLLFG